MKFNKVLFDELNDNQKKMMRYLEKNNKFILNESISTVAEKNNVSPSFITKTLKKVGFFGWKDYRAFAMAKMIIPKTNVGYMKYLENNLFSSIRATISNVDEMKISKIAHKMHETKGDIIFVGHGFSFYIAEDQARRYNKDGFRAFSVNPQNKEYQSFRKEDVIFVISNSGYTKSIISVCKYLNERKIKFYFMTMNPAINNIFKNIISGKMQDSENYNERERPKISRFVLLLLFDWIYTKFRKLKNSA